MNKLLLLARLLSIGGGGLWRSLLGIIAWVVLLIVVTMIILARMRTTMTAFMVAFAGTIIAGTTTRRFSVGITMSAFTRSAGFTRLPVLSGTITMTAFTWFTRFSGLPGTVMMTAFTGFSGLTGTISIAAVTASATTPIAATTLFTILTITVMMKLGSLLLLLGTGALGLIHVGVTILAWVGGGIALEVLPIAFAAEATTTAIATPAAIVAVAIAMTIIAAGLL